jgi:hypothetical protein
MVVTATTDAQYVMGGRHTARAKVTFTSPSGRSMTRTATNNNSVTVSLSMFLDGEDGLWTATNVGDEYCPVILAWLPAITAMANNQVTPFAYLVGVTVDKAAISKQADFTTAHVTVAKSLTCGAGEATVQMLFIPNPSELTLDPSTDQVPGKTLPFGANVFFVKGDWKVKTAANNPTAGTIDASGALIQVGCKTEGSLKETKTITVTPY